MVFYVFRGVLLLYNLFFFFSTILNCPRILKDQKIKRHIWEKKYFYQCYLPVGTLRLRNTG